MSDSRAPGIDIAESAAIAASFLCMVHCLALPLAIALLPALSDALAIPERFHIGILLFAAPTAVFALAMGWRQHGRMAPLAWGVTGIALLAAGLLDPAHETALTVAGSILLVVAHLRNWTLRHARRA